jgi:geranylgeranyl pyrophosphate synthase
MAQILTKIEKVTDSFYITKSKNKLIENELELLLKENDRIVLPVLKELIKKYAENSTWEALEYSLFNKSHFDRAFFVKLGCEAVGGNVNNILQALASVELRYASFIAIDDVFDLNDERMGNPSMPLKYSNNVSICYGAILKSISSIALLSSDMVNETNYKRFLELNLKDELTHHQVYVGQIDDIVSEQFKIEDVTDDFYLEMIKNSTGVDVGYCFELGCFLGGGSLEQQNYFYNFGVSLGCAMQVRDDLLDFVNDKNLINKEPFRDFVSKKKRLPIILAYRYGTEKEKTLINELFSKRELNEIDKITLSKIVSNEVVLTYIENLKNELLDSARQNLNKINSIKSSEKIISLIFNQIEV